MFENNNDESSKGSANHSNINNNPNNNNNSSNNSNNNNNSNAGNNNSNAPFMQRSVSGNAMAENGSDGILPLRFDGGDDIGLRLSYQYPNGSGQGGLSLLNDDNSFISSLMEPARTPLGLIQDDFPSTPSSIYSNRLLTEDVRFESDMQAAELKVVSSITDDANNSFMPSQNGRAAPNTSLPSGNMDDQLEQAAKSLQSLYVSPEMNSLGGNSQASNAPLLSQYHHSTLHGSGSSFFTQGGGTTQATAAPSSGSNTNGNQMSILGGNQGYGPGNAQSASQESILSFGQNSNTSGASTANPSVMTSHAPGLDPNASIFTGALPGGMAMPGFLPNGLPVNANPAAYTNILSNNMQQANAMMHAGQMPNQLTPQQQQQFYMQPPAFYVNPANGQPMFFRPPGQFGQEYMYPQIDANGMPIAPPMVGDPAQLQFQQQQMAQGFMQYPGMMPGAGMMPPGAFWTPDQQGNAIPAMYINPQQAVGMQMPGVDERNRMMYNQAMYQQMPAMAVQGGVPPNRGALNTGAMPFNMMQMPMAPNGAPMMPRPMIPINGVDGHGYMTDPNMMMQRNDDSNGGKGRDHNRDNNHHGNGHNVHRGDHANNNNNRHHNNGGNNNSNMNNRERNINNNNSNQNGNNNNVRNTSGGNNASNSSNNNNNNNNNSVGVNPVRDSLVEEFRSTFGKSRQWTLSDLTEHIVAFCQDQHGSRFIQQRLEVCTDSEKQLVFDEILPSAQILMTDVFGNYVLQKLFEYGNKDQCESLALLLKGQAVQLSMQMYGCRVVQKALEYVNIPRLVELVAEFESPQMLIRCVHDSNGNHVIQKCIEVVSKSAKDATDNETSEYLSSRIQFIINAFNGHVKELSSHPYGCRVVQRILEHCTNAQKAVILEELRQCCAELVQDCYGNYVIQFVMQHGWDADRAVLIREVQSNLLDFSQHKFASNVVEKCLQYASKKDRDEMIWTIINVTFDLNNPVDAKGHCVLESMVRDPYANYVVQKVIDVSDERQRAAIMRYVKENINQLRKYTYGKHIIVRLEKITNEKF